MLPGLSASVCETIPGADPAWLIVCDHASSAVPAGISLGVPEAVMQTHIALDIGAADLSRALAARLRCPAILAQVGRLVADFNRPPDAPGFIPEASDGIPIPGNRALPAADRVAREAMHQAFHAAIEAQIALHRPRLLISVHSFTPALATSPEPRPWPVAILWNHDARAARLGLEALRAEVAPVGANEPYSGKQLNYTMDRHAEAADIPYLGFELRQDMLADAAGIARWAATLERAIRHALAQLP